MLVEHINKKKPERSKQFTLGLHRVVVERGLSLPAFYRTAQRISWRTAAEAPPTPVLLLATQMRSVIELFCANFVGAPNLPPDAIVSEMAGTLLADNLQALGQSPLVVAILSVPFLPPLLEECSRLFGLPFTYCAPAPGGE